MEPPKDFTHTLPSQGHRWSGFWRSIDKKTGNRYTAKCKYCLSELEGKPDKLHQHVTKCNSWPTTQKTNYLKEASKETIPERKRIRHGQEVTTSEDDQEELAPLLKIPFYMIFFKI